MRQLRLVGLAEDGESLVLESPTGESYRLPVDDRVRAACRGDLTRLGQIEIELDNPLRPREIQMRVRAGESAEQVAASSGMPLDRVLRFASAVLQERDRVVSQARTTAVRPRSADALGTLVEERLVSRGTDPATLHWDAWRGEDGGWVVRLGWRHTSDREHAATWAFDLARRTLQPADPAAEQLSAAEFHARTITAVTPLAAAARAVDEAAARPVRRIDSRLDPRPDARFDARPEPRPEPRADSRPDSRFEPRPDRFDPRTDSRPEQGRRVEAPRAEDGRPEAERPPVRRAEPAPRAEAPPADAARSADRPADRAADRSADREVTAGGSTPMQVGGAAPMQAGGSSSAQAGGSAPVQAGAASAQAGVSRAGSGAADGPVAARDEDSGPARPTGAEIRAGARRSGGQRPADQAARPAETTLGGTRPAEQAVGTRPAEQAVGTRPADKVVGATRPADKVVGGRPADKVLGGTRPADKVVGGGRTGGQGTGAGRADVQGTGGAGSRPDSQRAGRGRQDRPGDQRFGSRPGIVPARADETGSGVRAETAEDAPVEVPRRIAAAGGSQGADMLPDMPADAPDDDRARRATVPSWDDILLGVRRRH